ncbi:hypothetical protein JXA02_02845 [candidate division KSB1 bacterium]|nr:hypothetical protein [candidate division KSB1 bacterium]RQW09987.1 MAG: hypothetical protein EH222_03115 [candidate division KSB1 bacterium]
MTIETGGTLVVPYEVEFTPPEGYKSLRNVAYVLLTNHAPKPGRAKEFLYRQDFILPEMPTIWAGQTIDVGTVTYTYDDENEQGLLEIVLTGGWELQDVSEPVKIQGYEIIPDVRPAAGQFTTYKGTELTVPLLAFPYYAIHLDVQLCE